MADLLRGGFVVRDECVFSFPPRLVLLNGRVECLDGLTLEVQKEIEVLEGDGHMAWVKTRQFTYQSWVRGGHSIFRYCTPHSHRPYAHKHVFDPFNRGRETEIIEIADPEAIPTLREAIEEMEAWHQENASRLGELR